MIAAHQAQHPGDHGIGDRHAFRLRARRYQRDCQASRFRQAGINKRRALHELPFDIQFPRTNQTREQFAVDRGCGGRTWFLWSVVGHTTNCDKTGRNWPLPVVLCWCGCTEHLLQAAPRRVDRPKSPSILRAFLPSENEVVAEFLARRVTAPIRHYPDDYCRGSREIHGLKSPVSQVVNFIFELFYFIF